MPRKAKTKETISSVNISNEAQSLANITESNVNDVELIEDSSEKNVVLETKGESIGFDNLYLILGSIKQSISTLQYHMKSLEKDMKKELKEARRKTPQNKKKVLRKPSGFAKPSNVSSELCDFMGRSKGSQIARTEVTQYLINYIKENALQYQENKKVILPDDKLKLLLGVDNKTEVTYFNLQGLMNKHFVNV